MLLFFIVYAFFFYARFLIKLTNGYRKVPTFKSSFVHPITSFSVVIPFRNEAEHLPNLLRSIAALDYPKSNFELIFIDDHSTDDSQKNLTSWRMENGWIATTVLENLRISGSPKKDAIQRALPIVAHKWVVTLDADCLVSEKWLQELDAFIAHNHSKMVVGGVGVLPKNGFLHRFQQMDILSLQATTIASFGNKNPFMCNGANFAYQKDFFLALNGFNGNESIASGDDVFLLQKAVAQFPKEVLYLKSKAHIVWTKSEFSWKLLYQQRVRWAAKATHYQNEYAETLALVVFLGNLSIVVATLMSVFGLISIAFPIVMNILKFGIDYRLLRFAQRDFYGKSNFLPILSSLFYPFFSTFVAFYALLGSYTWKERNFKK